jgi:hypothetical protein
MAARERGSTVGWFAEWHRRFWSRSTKRRRHLPTVCAARRSRAATALLLRPAAQPSTIRARTPGHAPSCVAAHSLGEQHKPLPSVRSELLDEPVRTPTPPMQVRRRTIKRISGSGNQPFVLIPRGIEMPQHAMCMAEPWRYCRCVRPKLPRRHQYQILRNPRLVRRPLVL